MVTWLLIVQIAVNVSVAGSTPPTATSQHGPFKSREACEAAGQQMRKAFSGVRFICVPDALDAQG